VRWLAEDRSVAPPSRFIRETLRVIPWNLRMVSTRTSLARGEKRLNLKMAGAIVLQRQNRGQNRA
jgi:hypothetical protein